MTDITVAIDKLDKIGLEKVKTELAERGLDNTQISTIQKYLSISGTNEEKLALAGALFIDTPTGAQGIAELDHLLNYPGAPPLTIDLTLARGLNYYTGTIFEVKALDVQIGSIGGGGRYDDLTGTFGVPNIPGVGISFGVDRIYDVMEELQCFPSGVHTGTKVLFFNLGEAESLQAFRLLQQLRDNGIPAELYHEQTKFDKQFKYAEKKGIPYIVILGSDELRARQCQLKDLRTGEQSTIGFDDLPARKFF